MIVIIAGTRVSHSKAAGALWYLATEDLQEGRVRTLSASCPHNPSWAKCFAGQADEASENKGFWPKAEGFRV